MQSLPIRDIAFTGFRVAREHPRAVAAWAVVQAAASLVMGALAVVIAGPQLTKLMTLDPFALARDAGKAEAAAEALAPLELAIAPCVVLLTAVFWAAMNRAVRRPESEGFGYLRLGLDELRQAALVVILAGLTLSAYLAIAVTGAVLVTLVSAGGMTAVLLAASATVVLALAAFLYIGVRLSLASPMTFVTGRFDLAEAWRLTRGHFWPMLGAYAFTAMLALMVYGLCAMVMGGAEALVGLAVPATADDYSSLARWLSPAGVTRLLLGAAASALVAPLIGAPAIVIHQTLAAPAPATSDSPWGRRP